MGQIAGYGNLRIAQQFPMMSLDEEGSDFPIRQHVHNSIESQPAINHILIIILDPRSTQVAL